MVDFLNLKFLGFVFFFGPDNNNIHKIIPERLWRKNHQIHE